MEERSSCQQDLTFYPFQKSPFRLHSIVNPPPILTFYTKGVSRTGTQPSTIPTIQLFAVTFRAAGLKLITVQRVMGGSLSTFTCSSMSPNTTQKVMMMWVNTQEKWLWSPKSGWTHDSDFNKCAKKKLKQPVHTTVDTSRILKVGF